MKVSEFEAKLNSIGWKLTPRGCLHYSLINSDGYDTSWMIIRDSSDNERGALYIVDDSVFGKYRGFLSINLQTATFEPVGGNCFCINLDCQNTQEEKNQLSLGFMGKVVNNGDK